MFITFKVKNTQGITHEALVPIDKAFKFAIELERKNPTCWSLGKCVLE